MLTFETILELPTAETSNKILFSIIVAALFAIRIYSNSAHCLPKNICSVFQLQQQISCNNSELIPWCLCETVSVLVA